MYACMYACMHACIHTCKHAYIHTCMHAYIHTYIHAHVHTYIDTAATDRHGWTDGRTDRHAKTETVHVLEYHPNTYLTEYPVECPVESLKGYVVFYLI